MLHKSLLQAATHELQRRWALRECVHAGRVWRGRETLICGRWDIRTVGRASTLRNQAKRFAKVSLSSYDSHTLRDVRSRISATRRGALQMRSETTGDALRHIFLTTGSSLVPDGAAHSSAHRNIADAGAASAAAPAQNCYAVLSEFSQNVRTAR